VVARFRCCHCRATFSTQSFATSYYSKRPELLPTLFYRQLACSGFRQMARELRCAHSSLARLAARLGRHALLCLAEHLDAGPVTEPLVVDGFESFAHSQYLPLHLNLVVGAESHYVYGVTLSPLRRKGRMTARQRRRRAALESRHGRVDPKAVELGMAEAIRLAAPYPQQLTVRSDEHPAYPRALRRLAGYAIRHECTPSVQARTTGNPLFPVNRADLQLRHNCANHKREGITFSKILQVVPERAVVLVLWLNCTKPFSENHDGGTPAMRRGLCATPLSIEQLLAWRRFPGRIALPEPWARYYRRLVTTPGLPGPRPHTLKLAY
jgi:hypothetical protein